nr:MFS transporter [Gluconobacter sp. Dm-62]
MIAAACVGNLLEWYDFAVYALFARYIAASIFHSADSFSQLAQSLLVFGLGAVVRPLGAILIGRFADRNGRGAALTVTCLLMGIGTLMIVCDPPYETGGRLSIVIICVARVLQGLSAGGEIGGAAAFLTEQASAGSRSVTASFLQATMGLSNMLGATVATLATLCLDQAQMISWGWRLPFVVGLLIVPMGLILRRAPAFAGTGIAPHQSEMPVLKTLLKQYRPSLGVAFGVSVLWTAAPYALVIYLPLYMQTAFGVSSHTSFAAYLAANVVLVLTSLLSGRLADRYGARNVMLVGMLLVVLAPAPLLLLAGAFSNPSVITLVMMGLFGTVGLFAGAAPESLAALFPPEIRATGIAAPYNVAAALFGGFAPMFLTFLGPHWHGIPSPALYILLAAVPAALALLWPRSQGQLRPDTAIGRATESIPSHDPDDGTVRTGSRKGEQL